MSQHRKDTPAEAGRAPIVLNAVGAGIAIGLTLRLAGADPWTEAHIIGMVFGVFTSGSFVLWTAEAISSRADARMALIRRLAAEDSARANAEEAALPPVVGTWSGDHPGQVLNIRWDGDREEYLIQGWMGDHWQIPRELPWTHPESLAGHLRELETTGELRPADDLGTAAVRLRLGLSPSPDGWTSGPGEETRVITWTDSGLPQREPGSFLTEAERAAWMDREKDDTGA